MPTPPKPTPEPSQEPGENLDFHLLPSIERLQAMTSTQRKALLELIKEWIGPLVLHFRVEIQKLEDRVK